MQVEIPQLHATSRVAVWLFLRGLALVYLFAFGSLIPQIEGLIGSHGILPAEDFLTILGQELGSRAFFALPSLFWVHLSDGMLSGVVWTGTGLSVLLFLDVAPALVLGLLWFLYLSVVSVGQDFLSFQWDGLLLEAGLLAVLLAPWRLRPRFASFPQPPLFPLFLLRWLLFRFMILSGLVKLASGDPSWRNLTALSYHYFTQPLPSPLSWYFHQAPLWFHRAEGAGVFAVELIAPFLIFGNSLMRRIACAAIVGLQVLILLTGNLAFLNWLTIALALLLLDDDFFASLLPGQVEAALERPFRIGRFSPLRKAAVFGLGGFLLFWSGIVLGSQFLPVDPSSALRTAESYVEPWRSVNGYGLFAVMTRTRGEIRIEGSDDGANWLAYELPHKPGDPARRPDFVAPWQPRLDWQMWFAALSTGEKTPWFQNLMVRLLQGSPEVLRLFSKNPFPDHPPLYVRAMFLNYRFTTPEERVATGAWWKAEPQGWYYPSISLGSPAGVTAPGP